ncbi:MAG: DHHW family protein [Dorea sp.]|nr:DHHW family protein [Dorea sp.]
MSESKKAKRKLHRRKLAALLFLMMLGIICLLNLVSGDKEYSEKENRMLQQRPQFTLAGIESGRLMEQYESYLSDQFVGRNFWVSLKTRIDLLAGKRESNGVFKGKNHYLLEDIASPDQEQMAQNIEAIESFENKYQDIPMYMMLVPNAANIESGKLPGFAVTEDQNQIFQNIQKELGDYIIWVDVAKTLKKHKSEDIYYRTDHHWTTLGAFYAFQELASSMKLDTSKVSEWKSYAVTSEFNGTLSATSGYETGYEEPIYIYAPENIEDAPEVVVNYVNEKKKTATLYDSSKLEEKDKYAMFLGGNFPMIDIRTTADTTDRLLLIKDSYANCLVPFLVPYYREIIIIDPRYYYGDITEVMESNKITSVLFLYNGNTFVEDNSINGVLENDATE